MVLRWQMKKTADKEVPVAVVVVVAAMVHNVE